MELNNSGLQERFFLLAKCNRRVICMVMIILICILIIISVFVSLIIIGANCGKDRTAEDEEQLKEIRKYMKEKRRKIRENG